MLSVITIQGKGTFRNSLNDLPMDYPTLKAWLATQPLWFKKPPKFIEDAHLPSFAEAMYSCIFDKGAFPTQDEYLEYYNSINREIEKKEVVPQFIASHTEEEILEAADLRVRRTYPSLIRDMAFAMYLKSEGWDVFWNPIVDFKYKTDLVVNKGGTLYGVALYLDSDLSNSFRKNKLSIRALMPDDFVKIELPMKLDDGEEVGRFKLYGATQAKNLAEAIDKAK